MTSVVVDIPPSCWLTSNRQAERFTVGNKRQQIHLLTRAALGRNLQPVPTPIVPCWTIAYPKGTGRADPSNAAPTTKACLDALVKAGLLPDDDSRHVIHEGFGRAPNLTIPRIHRVTCELLTPAEYAEWIIRNLTPQE